MRGLELARGYFEACGRPMLEREFPGLMPFLAAGLFGQGSECFGFDDAVSRDHDFEPGFCLLLPGEDVVDRRTAFLLERAYAKLPKEYGGFRRAAFAPVGGARHGVLRTGEFFTRLVGSDDGALSAEAWLRLPQEALAESVNGEVYFDNYGEVTRIRERLRFYPEDIRRKKLAAALLLMAQSGQYNYPRCLAHGETGAAQLAIGAFVEAAMGVIFLLNRRYLPYYKWRFRALRTLPLFFEEAERLEWLLTTGNEEPLAGEKRDVIESIAAGMIDALQTEGLTAATCGDLEKHARSVNDGISDPLLRNEHILFAAE
ncbi:MAG: DUF4037 domain-containing protein [bacterium]